MITIEIILMFLSALLSALIAGLFYGYSCSVNIGLGRLSDTEYLRAMQSINRTIINPVFFMSFLGTLIVLPVCTWLIYSPNDALIFYFMLAAAIIYAIAVFGVTIRGNVPLNNSLDRFNIESADEKEISKFRAAFEDRWNRFHLIRTVFSVITLILVLTAVFSAF
jgi:uncharacterized membrane protein